VHPQASRDELAQISIGRRDECLLALRERYLGRTLKLSGECPACQQPVEVAFDVRDLPRTDAAAQGARSHRLEHDAMVIDFRLPNSTDLEAAARCPDIESARNVLLDRCVLEAIGADGSGRPGSALPAEALEALEREIDRLDPVAVVPIDLDCPDCSHRWQSRLDVSEIVWTELAEMARRLLRDVSTLARVYHWSEQSILGMSARRRRTYLELADA
jgi:hypothetical protein